MREHERDALIVRIRGTWTRGGPSNEAWESLLDPLDAGAAGTTLARLARELEHAPSIARFLQTYKSTRTRDTDPIPSEAVCSLGRCDGSGWLDHPFRSGEHTYTGVRPCSCRYGRGREAVYRSIVGEHGVGDDDTPASPPEIAHREPPRSTQEVTL